MKQIYFIIISLATVLTDVYSQNTFPSTGNVGIGTTSPREKLNVQGSHVDSRILLHSTGGGTAEREADLLLWASEPGWTYEGAGIGNNVINNYANGTAINRINSARGGSYIRLLNNAMSLNIVAANGLDKQALYIAEGGNLNVNMYNGAQMNLNSSGTYWGKIGNPVAQVWSLGYGNGGIDINPVLSWTATGKVGLGTTSPSVPLEILSSENDKGLIVGSNGKLTKLYLHVAGGDYGYLFMGGNTVIRGNGNESYFDGSIGVGTSPGNYKLNVAGKIRANEIVVNTTGADYVFEPTYKLRSLSELETFIKENKHLPDIAPAREMQEYGVSSGEMHAKLLQKVEELTLYVIEQQKQIIEQQSFINAQNQRILQLEKKIEPKRNQ